MSTAPPAVDDVLVARFANYYAGHAVWGVLHVSFDDENFDLTISDTLGHLDDHLANQIAGTGRSDREPVTDEERELARLHDQLTPEQRRELRDRAEEMADGHLPPINGEPDRVFLRLARDEGP